MSSSRRISPRNRASNNKAPSPSKNKNKTKTKLRIKIKRWHGVAKWTWGVGDDEDDVCIVCQSAFEGVAPGVKFPGDECPVVVSNKTLMFCECLYQYVSIHILTNTF